jgi:hypothetical protein
MEVIMSTTSITHRPTSFVAAAAAVIALAAGGAVLSISLQSEDTPNAPAQQPAQTKVHPTTPKAYHAHPTTSGGHVMPGL